MSECVFCHRIDRGEVTAQNDLAAAFPDGYPISPGHTLVVPRRHEADYFDLTEAERDAITRLTELVRTTLDTELSPDAYNIGVNAGTAAGQTIDHAHLHLIPRYESDVEDPRGGVRWIRPVKARYWDE